MTQFVFLKKLKSAYIWLKIRHIIFKEWRRKPQTFVGKNIEKHKVYNALKKPKERMKSIALKIY